MPFGKALALVASAVNMPFGYTLAIWASATLTIDRFGPPNLLEVFALLCGAVGAYLSLSLPSAGYLGPTTAMEVRKATLINVASLAVAITVSLAVRLAPFAWLGFLLAGFVSTAVYMLVLALLLWWHGRDTPPEQSGPRL
jgi:hypothetical protein